MRVYNPNNSNSKSYRFSALKCFQSFSLNELLREVPRYIEGNSWINECDGKVINFKNNEDSCHFEDYTILRKWCTLHENDEGLKVPAISLKRSATSDNIDIIVVDPINGEWLQTLATIKNNGEVVLWNLSRVRKSFSESD